MSSSSRPTTDGDSSIERRTTAAHEPFILGTRLNLLDLVVESDICQREQSGEAARSKIRFVSVIAED